MSTVIRFQHIPYRDNEILRYAQANGKDEQILNLLEECKSECTHLFDYKVCYDIFSISRKNELLELGNIKTDSQNLKNCLEHCTNAIVFVASVGFNIDRLIKKYSLLSPLKSLMFSAIGSERVESLTDTFCKEMALQKKCRPRFSPGFGDLPLSLQQSIFAELNVIKSIAVTLNDSLLMSPSKSVSAIIGILD